ncbi:hypothetical protein A8B79_02410 [Balneola sp. EhC07]|uniref:N-6 DNA methylase n=1 Tax=Balneola sp. EhC07 TaxID=1849360 RepID=UPI0007F3738F|nr:N-6 DNA methylase [Balneola sp. EhC07]OAN62424.1 hypothetical protein A8B79_02410 [Balneola sp. EhC07]
MKRELTKIYNYLREVKSSGLDSLFDSELEWRIVYLFLRRYKALMNEFTLVDFGFKVEKYLSVNSNDLDPYNDLFEPFFSFLKEKNPKTLKSIDLQAYIKKDLYQLAESEVIQFENKLKEFEVNDFSIKSFSVEEFDEFFISVIELTKSRDRHSYWERSIPKELSKIINKTIADTKVELYVGDHTGQIAFDGKEDNSKKIISGDDDTILWYYLRVILSGNVSLEFKISEFSALLNEEADFKFVYPPIGKIDLTKLIGRDKPNSGRMVDFELFYANQAIDTSKSKSRILLLMPIHTLYSNTKDFKAFRKKVIDNKYLKTVILFPQGTFSPGSSISYCLLELDTNKENQNIVFINGPEIEPYITPSQTDKYQNFFNEIGSNWIDKFGFYPYVTNASINEIKHNNYSLAFSYYINASKNEVINTRNRDEELVSLTDVLDEIKTDLVNVVNEPFIGMSQLGTNSTDYKLSDSQLPKYSGKEKLRPLNRSAVLLGTIIGSIKPSIFKYTGQTVYTKSNVKVYEIPELFDVDYLMLELRSEFVSKQFLKIQSGTTIPSIRTSELKNIYLRLPPLETQKEIVRESYQEFAQEKLEEIKSLNKDLEYIEKDVFSSFAHDFGKILANARASIEVIEGYIQELAKRNIISMQDSIFFDEKPTDGERVIDLLKIMIQNHDRIQESLQEEVKFFTSSKVDQVEEIELIPIILDWSSRQVQKNYKIFFHDALGLNFIEHSGRLPLYKIEGNKEYLLSVLNNFLDNAIEHGFKKGSSDNQFIIILDGITNRERGILKVHVGNNGLPFPSDFTCEDFFKLNHKGPQSSGQGKGGNSIKRKLNKMGASIDCSSSILDKKTFPVQFEIKFKAVEIE